MKLSLIFMIIGCLQLGARGLSQSVSLSIKNAPVEKVFREIEKQTGYGFIYAKEQLAKMKPVDVNVINTDLVTVLNIIFKNQSFTYVISGNNIGILEKPAATANKSEEVLSSIPITGIVVDENEKPFENVSVLVKSTKKGTTTDKDGKFTIQVPEGGDVLVFSYVGYETTELSVNKEGSVSVKLKLKENKGEDIVIIGYGTQKRSDLTGAITKIKPEDLNQGSPNLNVTQMLEGRVAGLYINQHGGDPGTSPTVYVRGNGSLNIATATPPNANNPNPLWNPLVGNSADPLVIVDGFPLALLRDINTISPNDIEEITVLKDASSTAIYGARGANGVIIITTKSGKRNSGVSVNYSAQVSIDAAAKTIPLLNNRQYLTFYHDLYADSTENTLGSWATFPYSTSQIDSIVSLGHGTTDWQKAVTKSSSAANQSHHISLSGGNGPLTFMLTGDYFNQFDNISPASYQRYYGKSRVSYQQGKFGADLELAYSYENRNSVRNDYFGAITSDPSQPVYDSIGKFSINKYNAMLTNPLWASTVTKSFWNLGTTFLYANLHYEILPGLNLRSDVGYSVYNYQDFYGVGSTWNNGIPNPLINNASVQYYDKTSSNVDLYADYSKRFDKHHLTVLIGGTDKANTYKDIISSSQNFASNAILYYAIQAGNSIMSTTSWVTDRTLSGFGRINYDYDSRYLLTVNFRADAATQFGPDNKWGYFPSVAVGWRIDKEAFMHGVSFIKSLKLRGGYGIAGNDNIPNNLTSQLYSFGNYNIGGGSVPTIVIGSGTGATYAPNPNLKWEQVKTVNLGLDISMGNMFATFDYYLKNSDQLLLNKQLPQETGHSNIIVNEGKVQNKGFEGTVGYNFKNLFGSRITWLPQFNFAYNKSLVKGLGGDTVLDGNIWVGQSYYGYNVVRQAGQPFYAFNVYHYDGVWQQKDAAQAAVYGAKPGDPKIRDVNKDSVLDKKDRYFAGSGDPTFTFGFANRFTFGAFDLSLFFQGVYGNKVFNSNRMVLDNPQISWRNNLMPDVLGRWTPSNPSNTEDSKVSAFSSLLAQSDKYLEDASFLRLKEMVLGFNMPLKSKTVKSLHVSLGITNIFIITKYTGLNPDVRYTDNQWNLYPYARTFTFGLNASF